MTAVLTLALALIIAEASDGMAGAAPAKISPCAPGPAPEARPVARSAEGQDDDDEAELPSDPRPVVRRHLAEGRRLTALSMILTNYENHGKNIPGQLPDMLRRAQEDFLKGKGGEFRAYRLRRGDTLSRIGGRLMLSVSFLKRVNRIRDERTLLAGQEIKVVDGPFRAVVDLSDRRLRVCLKEALVREYDAAVGTVESPTPEGEFEVRQKVREPQYDRGDEHYPPLDPRNPAGTRWMRLEGAIGIHGTNEPESIGKAVSDGCIRLRNRDVEELFDLLVLGSPVVIKP